MGVRPSEVLLYLSLETIAIMIVKLYGPCITADHSSYGVH